MLEKFKHLIKRKTMIPSATNLTTSRGKILIRPAGPTDAVLFSELRLEALRDNPVAFGSSYEDLKNSIQEWAHRILQTNPQDGCNFVAEIGQELQGMAAIRRESGRKRWHAAIIGGVFIRPTWRGFGIVDELLKFSIDWAINQQIVILKLAVVTTNHVALKVYQRHGFEIYGVDPKVILHEGVYYDEYLMSRQLC